MWYLNPGTIDWWPHEQLDVYHSGQIKVPTQILGGEPAVPSRLIVDLKLLKVKYAFSEPPEPLKAQHRNSTQGPEDGISRSSNVLVSLPRFPMIFGRL